MSDVCVVIPALDEAESLPLVLGAIPPDAGRVIVVDNGSTDGTAAVAIRHGAELVQEPRRGYGQACLSGIEAAGDCNIIVFLDADFCDDPGLIPELLKPILNNDADLVLGSRCIMDEARIALTPQQRWGNALACLLMRIFWRGRFTDLGPFRAIRRSALKRLEMEDKNFGWTVEMQIRALKCQLQVVEIPVPYRLRKFGQSKISQTVKGVLQAAMKIFFVIGRELWLQWRPSQKKD
ncbi:MAG: glycosyltransferase family 2 protein [Pseudomonadota bacterium]